MFWADVDKGKPVDGSLGATTEKLKAIAVGSTEGGKERREDVCVLTRTLPSRPSTAASKSEGKLNGHAVEPELVSAAVAVESRPELLDAPTEEENSESEKAEVQEGNLVPASRPEPTTFHTASEGLPKAVEGLDLNEKVNGETLGEPHATKTANLLDPKLPVGEGAK